MRLQSHSNQIFPAKKPCTKLMDDARPCFGPIFDTATAQNCKHSAAIFGKDANLGNMWENRLVLLLYLKVLDRHVVVSALMRELRAS